MPLGMCVRASPPPCVADKVQYIQVQLYQQVLAEAALPTADQAADEDAVASGCSLPLIAKLRTICSCPWQSEEAIGNPAVSSVMSDGSQLHKQLGKLSGLPRSA